MANNKFEEYVGEFYNYLIDYKYEYLQLFSNLEIQIEGWFRGELMCYFEAEKNIKLTTKNREVRISEESGKKVDFKIPIDKQCYWIELKHIIVGEQKSKDKDQSERKKKPTYNIDFYLRDYNPSNIIIDIKKLAMIKDNWSKYVLCFISVNNEAEPDFDVLNALEGSEIGGIKMKIKTKKFNIEKKFGYFLLKVNEKQD